MAFENWDEIRMISILDVCSCLGIPVEKMGSSYWCKLRADEGHASCKLYFDRNNGDSFCDFGNCKNGGDVIKFAAEWLGCDYQTASEQLARSFNIAPLNNTQYFDRNELGNHEWAKLGVHGDMASKNLDLDLEKYSMDYIQRLSERYRIPVNQLRKEFPRLYEYDILRNRAIPTVYRMRNNYFFDLYVCLTIQKELTGKFDINNVPREDLERLMASRDEVKRAEALLMKAVKGSDVSYKCREYDLLKDITSIYLGEILFEVGPKFYRQVEGMQKKYGSLQLHQIPIGDYLLLDNFGVNEVPHAAFLKLNEVSIVATAEHMPAIMKCIDECEKSKEAAKLQEVVVIEYKGIMFDNWTVDADGNPYGVICAECAEKYQEVLGDDLAPGGEGACAVQGCDHIADGEGCAYRVSFQPELIRTLTQGQMISKTETLCEEVNEDGCGGKVSALRENER